jgi:hypothetical protein
LAPQISDKTVKTIGAVHTIGAAELAQFHEKNGKKKWKKTIGATVLAQNMPKKHEKTIGAAISAQKSMAPVVKRRD